MKQEKKQTEPGTPQTAPGFKIVINTTGPYLVYGNPTLKQEFIIPDEPDGTWEYKQGISYKMDTEPVALCRCGASKNKPYCDGSHTTAGWQPQLTADTTPLLQDAETYEGPYLQLRDNPKYCAHARFCMARGTVWDNVESDKEQDRELAIQGSLLCPSGRLKIRLKEKNDYIEPPFTPSLGLIEDPQKNCSGPLWVKGGIPIEDNEGNQYETRNRITLCRCGASKNKPYCDGQHIKNEFNDEQPGISPHNKK